MKSLCAILAVLSLVLFAKTIESRGIVDIDWTKLMKDQRMGEIIVENYDSAPKLKADCHENEKKPFFEVVEFEPRPNVSAYNDDEDSKAEAQPSAKDSESKGKSHDYPDKNGPKADKQFVAKEKKQSFDEDFEPRPNLSVYND